LIEVLNTGDKPTDEQVEAVVKVAEAVAKGYIVEEKHTAQAEK
jgi:hypothetical protein